METETELVRKYEQILGTMRAQIKALKGKVVAAEGPEQSSRRRASPSPVRVSQDFALVEFKEELVRKEFELEECLLELEEVKSELKKQSGRPVPPLRLQSSRHSEDGEAPSHPPQQASSWEDEVQIREDLSGDSKDSPVFAPDSTPPLPEVDILRQKVEVVERENRLLREKVDLCDNEIRSLLTKTVKVDEQKMRATAPVHKEKPPERPTRGRETAKLASGPQSRHRSVEDFEQELHNLKADLAEKERLLAASSYRASQLAEDLRQSRPGLNSLWQELKHELNRDIGSPRTSQLQRKIENLQGSVSNSSLNAATFNTLLNEKEEALADLSKRYNALMEQYQAVLKTQNTPKPQPAPSQEAARLEAALKEKEVALSEVTSRFNSLSDQLKSMLTTQSKEQTELREREAKSLQMQIAQRDVSITEMQAKLAELSEQLTALQSSSRQGMAQTPAPEEESPPANLTMTLPAAMGLTPTSGQAPRPASALRPTASPMKEGSKKAGALNAVASLLAKKAGIAAKGKTGPVRTPR